MKTPVHLPSEPSSRGRFGCLRLTLLIFLLPGFAPEAFSSSEPVITEIRRDATNVVVMASVPAGPRKVTLETRERLGGGGWMPRAVARLDGTGGRISFALPVSRRVELMRLRADDSEPLPESFYTGTNQFAGEPTSGQTPGVGPVAFEDNTMGPGVPEGESGREVVESDLWQIRGDTLYFFNQLRGLQVIDISQPDAPNVLGLLSLPAAGEQMYLLGEHHVLLLAQSGCYFSNQEESQVLVVDTTTGQPSVTSRLPVPGRIQESRLVGTVLYVASQFVRSTTGETGTVWEWGLAVSSFDLADPAAPQVRDTVWYAGYGNIVSATDRYFFVVTQDGSDWRRSIVHTIDISDPAGAMRALNTLLPEGRVLDKFKLNVEGDVFTVISQVQTTTLYTQLETFSFADPARPVRLGSLSLGLSERLHATRFAGDRVYVVTFFVPFRMDPLWVVDLSDPARPAVKGELEVPGFSTFLHPRGHQLVALGIETNSTTVSLFDVADPAAPALLSRVQVGDGWAWTEANWDEKAFRVIEDAGLILLPFQSWTADRYVKRVQLIDLNPNTLAVRGAIDHEFVPRRATLHQDRILSLSGWELLSVDATDRDHPRIVSETELAWSADRVVAHGDFLVELETGNLWWSEPSAPVLRVAKADAPNTILTSLELEPMPITGVAASQGRLYVVQSPSRSYPIWWVAEDGSGDTAPEPEPNLTLTVLDLESLPELRVTGQTRVAVGGHGNGSWEAVWPREDLLVWSGGGMNFWWWDFYPVASLAGDGLGVAAPMIWWPPWFFGGGGQLLAFDVSDDAHPNLASELNLGTNSWWNFSRPLAAQGLVYLSHQATDFEERLAVPGLTTITDGKTGTWVTRHFLNVVDYADAAEPLVRPPVNMPGQLRGLSHEGAVVYTVGYRFDVSTGTSDWNEILDASAYDGVSVHLVDSLRLPSSWPHPLLVTGPRIYLGVPGYDYTTGETKEHALQAWTLANTGKFQQLSQVALAQPANQLKDFDGLLAVQQSDNLLVLFDTTTTGPELFRRVGQDRPTGCLWYDLDKADGVATRGVWLPLGVYGVAFVPRTE